MYKCGRLTITHHNTPPPDLFRHHFRQGNKRYGIRQGITGLDLRSEDFYFLTTKIVQVAEICCKGRVVSALEGGYGRAVTPTPDPSGSKGAPNLACCAELELDQFSHNVAGHLRGLAHMEREILTPSPSAKRSSPMHTTKPAAAGHCTRASAPKDGLPINAVAASEALAAAEMKKRG